MHLMLGSTREEKIYYLLGSIAAALPLWILAEASVRGGHLAVALVLLFASFIAMIISYVLSPRLEREIWVHGSVGAWTLVVISHAVSVWVTRSNLGYVYDQDVIWAIVFSTVGVTMIRWLIDICLLIALFLLLSLSGDPEAFRHYRDE